MKKLLIGALMAGLGLGLAQQAAPLRIGVVVSATGPAASLGIPERNTLVLLQEQVNKRGGVAGRPVEFVIIDDASDTTQAVRAARRLITEENVLAIIGTTTTPASLGMIDVVAEAGIPNISMAANLEIVFPVDDKRRWVFKTPQTEQQMSVPIVRDMVASNIKEVAYIGFNDAYGEGWAKAFEAAAKEAGINVVASERFARTDTSVTGQILRILSRNPDAVLIGGSGTAPVLPQRTLRERGYKGLIYQTHGVANPDFLRVGGENVVGTRLPAGPVLVFDQLPANFPNRQVALSYVQQYEIRFGIGSYSTFGGHAYDAWIILRAALERTLGSQQTSNLAAFRRTLRDQLEATRGVVGTHGIFNMSATDHLGLRFQEAAVMVEVVREANGRLDWKLLRTFR